MTRPCLAFALALLSAPAAAAVCAPEKVCSVPLQTTETWTRCSADAFGDTTYTVEAPCYVFVTKSFSVTLTVSDPSHPDTDVGFGWALRDTPAGGGPTTTVAGGGGLGWITTDAAGQWQRTVPMTYTGAPVDHTIQFAFTDLGSGGSAHWWTGGLLGALVVDPYPPEANAPPVAVPFSGATVQLGEPVTLGATVADLDGDAVSYRWAEGAAVLAEGSVVAASGGAPVALPLHEVLLPLGAHLLTLSITDGSHAVEWTVSVAVVDTTAPTLAPVASASVLWPPDGTLRRVTVIAHAHDGSGGPVLLGAEVSSDQPSPADRSGRFAPDASVVAIDSARGEIVVELRAARSGGPGAGGRTYWITVTATDEAGNASSADVPVEVPHDLGRR